MKRLLYFGADIDISPILLFPKIKEFVFMDLGDVNHLAHWEIEVYKGFIISAKPRHWKGKNLQSTLKMILLDYYPDTKVTRKNNLIKFKFDRNRELKYYINVFLPVYNKKNACISVSDREKIKWGDFIPNSLSRKTIDAMHSCNILYISGYFPGYPIIAELKLNEIYTQNYIMYERKIYKQNNKWKEEKYCKFDLQKKFKSYNPPNKVILLKNIPSYNKIK